MSTLRQAVADYLATRRTMGFKVEGLTKLLTSFVSFCEAREVSRVENDIAIAWATTMIKVPVSDALFARRMDAVRVFARYQHALDPATHVPPDQSFNRRYQPKAPNVFNDEEVLALLTAAKTLTPQRQAVTWPTLIGLLATTGMRPGEACRLSVGDLDLSNGVVQVLETKFGKSRLVFIHPTTATVLGEYLKVRQDWVGTAATACPALFLNTRRGPINPGNPSVTFNQIVAAAGITTQPGHRPPRLHDLRHTYAVTTMPDWYRDGTRRPGIGGSEAQRVLLPAKAVQDDGDVNVLVGVDDQDAVVMCWHAVPPVTMHDYQGIRRGELVAVLLKQRVDNCRCGICNGL